MNGSDELHISFETNVGREGEDDHDSNPFTRAVDRLFREGKPIQKLGLCFTELPEATNGQPIARWLGVFVFSAGERLIYFPGYTTVPSGVQTYRGPNQMAAADVTIDHLSLEKNGTDWHITSPGSEDHFGGPKTLPLGNERSLWFGMSVASDSVLRPVMNRTIIRVRVPSTDVNRRLQVLQSARDAVEFPLVQLNPLSYQTSDPVFYHFAAIVGPVGFADYTGTELGFPIGSPFLEPPLPAVLSQLPATRYRLSLAPHCDIQIVAMTLPGRISVPIALTGPSMPQTT